MKIPELLLTAACVIALAALAGCSSPRAEFRLASYNIRYDAAADAENGDGWDERKGAVAEMILSHDIDIAGTQEGDRRQLDDLLALMPDYDCICHPYGGRNGDLHNCATFYRRDRFELLDEGTFWYSETPDTESLGWDATDLRICNWGRFREKRSGKEFYLFNSHFFWRLEEAKRNSGKVLCDKVRQIAGDAAVICTGDFNSTDSTPQIKDITALLRDARRISASAPTGPEKTDLGGGNFQGAPKARIDYVFVSDGVGVGSYDVPEDVRQNGHYPSDHLPVVCRLAID